MALKRSFSAHPRFLHGTAHYWDIDPDLIGADGQPRLKLRDRFERADNVLIQFDLNRRVADEIATAPYQMGDALLWPASATKAIEFASSP